ncbi:MAG: PpiC-type peptidyl-prolyl cis-trans isomerase [Deltaproteobacteria bacterium]|nr:PpiC-type peptidyl-prolyl cis-trans isomerase [Deltaproteobacteria bacterium]
MLSILRRNAGSWAIKIILTFIALTFIWWGVGTYSERDRNVAATVGGEKITSSDLSEAVANLEKSYREVYGAAFTPEMIKALNLKKQAMDSLVQRKVLLEEAAKMGLSATDEEVRREIAATPAFQQNGQFRDDLYRSVLSYNRVTPAGFEATKRVEITIRKVKDLIAAGALVPETEAKELFRLTSRKIRLVVVTADPRKAKADTPTEGEILAKYEQGKERFRTPARVKLAVADFTPDRFGREVNPSESEIKAFYETNSDRFRTEEQRLVSRIVLPFGKKDRDAVRKKAEALLAKASTGKAEFDALAKSYARGKNAEAWLSRKDAGPTLSEPLFQAAVATVVGPIELPGSFVLARVDRIRFPEALPLSQVRDRVVEQIRHEKGKDLAVVKAYEAQPKAAAAKSVKATAAAYGVPVTETGWVGAEGAPGLPPALVQDALLLPPGEVAPVKTVGDDHYLFQVTAKQDSRVPPLSEVRDKVAEEVIREKKAAAARTALQQVLAISTTAAELAANARKAGLASSLTDWFAPLSEPVPEALAGAGDIRKDLSALSAKAPVSRKMYQDREGDLLAAAFSGEQLPSDAEWAQKKDEILKGVTQQKQNVMLEAFLSDSIKSVKVEINPEALK